LPKKPYFGQKIEKNWSFLGRFLGPPKTAQFGPYWVVKILKWQYFAHKRILKRF